MMKTLLMALGAAAVLVSTPVIADERNPDLVDRLGRALQNNDNSRDRDRSQNYGSSGYERRDAGRDYNGRYDGRDRDEVRRQRQLDEEQRDLDRRRRQMDQRGSGR